MVASSSTDRKSGSPDLRRASPRRISRSQRTAGSGAPESRAYIAGSPAVRRILIAGGSAAVAETVRTDLDDLVGGR